MPHPANNSTARPTRRAVLVGAAIASASPIAVAAAPRARLISPKWENFGAGGDPDAAPWGEFLARWTSDGTDGVVRVDYAGALAAGARAPLSAWLAATASVDPTGLRRDAAMAWWINLYNALTVDLVLAHYPVETIREVMGGLFNTGPWDEDVARVAGADLSLNDIEHGVLRPIWADARIHYAVNCASIGCPNLKRTPWTSATLEADLDAAARAYVNHPRGAAFAGGRLTVSKIYDWYDEDFGGSEAGVIQHLKRHAASDLAARLDGARGVDAYAYDWSLNAA